ncbi:MAG: hypothetical protein M3Y41_21855 [Pseudomonadota bacterium]|nr:hypothetical protein [Pseudomonadota bacterium]
MTPYTRKVRWPSAITESIKATGSWQFSRGTAPHDENQDGAADASSDSFEPTNVGERIDYVAYTVIGQRSFIQLGLDNLLESRLTVATQPPFR